MRTEIMVLELAAMLGMGGDNKDVSSVSENLDLTKPEGCEIEKDIRHYESFGGFCHYQILCGNSKNDKLTLYERTCTVEGWRKIELR
ncbi:hypothetical protein HY494_01050 [Candidatus Woesearchaeota archaeon]|nr:hypothetical protein [Candidatus Woesearchaeota archaeon]